MIKVGIWGCGGISPFHRRAYQVLQEKGVDVKVVALCDINSKALTYQDSKEMIEAEKNSKAKNTPKDMMV